MTLTALIRATAFALFRNARLVPKKTPGGPPLAPEHWQPLATAVADHLRRANFRVEEGAPVGSHSTPAAADQMRADPD